MPPIKCRALLLAVTVVLLATATAAVAEQGGRRVELAQRAGKKPPDPEAIVGGEMPTPDATCSTAYHAAVQVVREGAGQLLGPSVRAVRTADPQWPGRWLFASKRGAMLEAGAPKGARARLADGDRVCLEQVSKGGRLRCMKWGDRPIPTAAAAAAASAAASSEPSDEEVELLRTLEPLMRSRGAPPEFAGSGRFDWLTRRLVADLRSYLAQPGHPLMCEGAPQMLDFYVGQSSGLRRRAQDVAALAARARAMAELRVATVRGAPQVAAAAGAESDARPTGAAGDGAAAIRALLEEVAAALLPEDRMQALRGETALIAMLGRAATALTAEPVQSIPPERRSAVVQAFRMIEAAIYADLHEDRHNTVEVAILGTIGALRKAHQDNCGCN